MARRGRAVAADRFSGVEGSRGALRRQREYVLDLVPLHRDNLLLLQEVCNAIMQLSFSPSNITLLGEFGACKTLVESFRISLCCEVCSGGMLNMAVAEQNRYRLIDAGAVPELRTGLINNADTMTSQTKENIVKLFLLLGADDDLIDQQEHLVDESERDTVSDLIQSMPKDCNNEQTSSWGWTSSMW